MTTILYPTRGGDTTHRNQDWVFSFARQNEARLILLYVSDVRFLDRMPTTIGIDRVWEELDEMGDFLLTMAQDRADVAGVKAEKIIKHGGFRNALKSVIEEESVSVVILGRPAEETAITTMEYLESVAEYLTTETDVELFLIHNGEILDHLLPHLPGNGQPG